MHRQEPIAKRVYTYLYPANGSDAFAHRWRTHITVNLIPEVQTEVALFYGESESLEARYPGLDYTNPVHRRRLSQYPHHRRLFDTIDALRLTPTEVFELCCWDGSLFARRRYERLSNKRVVDTTGDNIPVWVARRRHASSTASSRRGSTHSHSHSHSHPHSQCSRMSTPSLCMSDQDSMSDVPLKDVDDDNALDSLPTTPSAMLYHLRPAASYFSFSDTRPECKDDNDDDYSNRVDYGGLAALARHAHHSHPAVSREAQTTARLYSSLREQSRLRHLERYAENFPRF